MLNVRCLLVAMVPGLLAACSGEIDPLTAFERGQYETAYSQWLPQAETGDAEAQNYIGLMYYLGLGQRRDYPEALRWFERAAEQGHPDAQRNTGIMYQNGRGLPQHDYYQAYIWFYAAQRQGNELAKAHISLLATKLTPNQQMRAREMARSHIFNPVDDKSVSTRHVPGPVTATGDYQGD